ncbi:MAG: nucleoside triphosphate pyrophosphohydrolase [Desulfonatronovibrio sp. MSAO_Bac4]|nr:MAG: nucleoside triphosphate pyrophosphohydrolase [Desulfonatronovibrio sp. MSAO_Bac4]
MNQESGYDKIMRVITTLLGPDGCPWDREQTPGTLCDYLTEETFELISAIRSKNIEEIKEEMGDVFFLLFFIARFYESNFTLDDVWVKSADKMIARHPHVFEDEKFNTRDELMRNWEKVKKQEKADRDNSVFSSIPRNLPPLLMAYRLNSKASRIGFTWGSDQEVLLKLQEEWQELEDALNSKEPGQAEQEFGDYLFALVEYGRRKKIKANAALSVTNAKFMDRVGKMEKLALKKGLETTEMSMEELDALWDEVKKAEGGRLKTED